MLPIAELTPDAFARALSEIEPIQQNPLDALAAKLKPDFLSCSVDSVLS